MKTLSVLFALTAVVTWFSWQAGMGILVGATFTIGSILYHSYNCKSL